MKLENILIEKKGNIGVITLNRADKLNAASKELFADLRSAIDDMAADDNIRVVILAAAGRAFCVGADLGQIVTDFEAIVNLDGILHFINFDKPIIAAVNGVALGNGAQLSLMCDIIIASERASFSFMGAAIGAVCTYAIVALVSQVGLTKAKELMFTCDRISAEEALRIGLVNKVVPHEQLMDAAFEMARKILKVGPLAVKFEKQGINAGLMSSLPFLRKVLEVVKNSEDIKEGARAFAEGRQPEFKGR